MTTPANYPELDQLAGFFNEEWTEDAPTWQALIDFYADGTAAMSRRQVVVELEQLLSAVQDEDELERVVLWELGFRYVAAPQTYREWLVELRDKLESTL